MIQINDQSKEVVITMSNTDKNDLAEMKNALLELIAKYNYQDFGNGASGIIYHATILLKELDLDLSNR